MISCFFLNEYILNNCSHFVKNKFVYRYHFDNNVFEMTSIGKANDYNRIPFNVLTSFTKVHVNNGDLKSSISSQRNFMVNKFIIISMSMDKRLKEPTIFEIKDESFSKL